ncbi:FAD-dependent oxidoreductase domain-containing protein 1 homolog [Arctopsyche grandis]|uniref:FAD-dependent oxidoreductase domain-containing protein 1 homolog n=1 Tax=Arctopsyche grandis TaxID=121162 RepID=UPI00406DA3FA
MFSLKLLRQRQPLRIIRRLYSDDVKPPRRPAEHPASRTFRILGNDAKTVLSYFSTKKPQYRNYDSANKELDMFPVHGDVVIIGGGIMGSSIAYFLKERAGNGLNVIVIEKDPTYKYASTVLSCGGLRQQFSVPENIQMSQYAAAFFKDIKMHLGDEIDLQFTPHGYLLLATEKTVDQLEANFNLQQEYKVKNELMSPKELKSRYPWLNTDGIVLGCRGLESEGWFDPWMLLGGFKKRAQEIGVQYVTGEVTGFEFELMRDVFESGVHPTCFEKLKSVVVKTEVGVEREIQFSQVVLAAGAASGDVGRMARIGTGKQILSVPIPIEPRKRYVYCFNCQGDNAPAINTPMTFDPSGTYFRREGLGNNFIAGRSPSPDNEPDVKNLDVDYNFFDTDVWPNLAERVPAFEALKITSAWAGYYEFNTFDENGIIGQHPYHSNMYIAAGFSGHGIQQAPAVGRCLTELILDGEFVTIDLNRLSFDRILLDKPVFETNVYDRPQLYANVN